MANWDQIEQDAITAAKGVLGGAWNAASSGAEAQIAALVSAAEYIDTNRANMTDDEVSFLEDQHKSAIQNVLTAYEAIGIAAAINTVNAIFDVLLKAVPSLVLGPWPPNR